MRELIWEINRLKRASTFDGTRVRRLMLKVRGLERELKFSQGSVAYAI